MIFHHYHHIDPESLGLLRAINRKLDTTLANQEKIMASLDDVLKDVTDESTQLDGLSTLMAGLRQQVADALAGTTLPPAVQAKVDAVFAQAETNKGKIATALNTGVPAAPPNAPAAPST
jgi:hypothetical protein